MPLTIESRLISSEQPPYIVAELSANHNGSLERALATIEAAKHCGADAIKIQTYTADSITIDCDSPDFIIQTGPWKGYKLYDLYKEAGTPYEWHQQLFDHARKIGITLFSTPFDDTAVNLLEELKTPAYKIASFELIDLPLIRRVAKTGKPLIMSTGMASESEIEEAISAARGAGCRELMLLHCISSYPAPIEQSNLRRIPQIARRFGVEVGLSDHTLGTTAAVAAVSMNACLIEKHFTLDHSEKGPDSEFSIGPAGLRKLCQNARSAWAALGSGDFDRQTAEAGSVLFRRSIYFVKDLQAGHQVEPGDIKRVRPGFGLAPKYFDQLIGKHLKVPVSCGTATTAECFVEPISYSPSSD
jgi:pseudaminic acid synthase